jgi:hypothetical protein
MASKQGHWRRGYRPNREHIRFPENLIFGETARISEIVQLHTMACSGLPCPPENLIVGLGGYRARA